jgi:thioredoxin family protein
MAQAKGAITPSTQVETPETYLGTYRAQAYTQALQPNADVDYGAPAAVPTNAVELAGHWRVESHQIVAGAGAKLLFEYVAPRIYVVAAPSVDGSPNTPVRVPDDDLYQLAHMPTAGPHKLVLSVPAGSSLYSFTFG